MTYPLGVSDRGGAVVDGALSSVAGNKHGMIRETDDHAFAQGPRGRILDGFAAFPR